MNQIYTKQEYQKYVDSKSPNSHLVTNCIWAFVVGGIICIIGQFISNYFLSKGLSREITASITSSTLIFFGVLLTAFNLYDDIGKKAGAGSIVPITGFANSVASPAMEFKTEGYVLGLGAKMFTVAGPVLVYGISTSIIVGIIHYFIH